MLQFDCRKQRQHTRNYKVSTPYCRKIIINHDHVKQVTENILELNLIKITFVLSFIQSKYYQIKREVLQSSHSYQVTLSYWLFWLHVTTFRVVCSSSTSIDCSCFNLILRDHWFDCKLPQLYIATLQQDLHNKYISISYSNIPELVVPIMNGSC